MTKMPADNKLHNKLVGIKNDSIIIQTESEISKEDSLPDKILFKDITGNEPGNLRLETQKLIFTLSYNQSDSIVFNVQEFLLESNGKWRRILNMGNFTVTKEISSKENICNLIAKTGIIAQYK